MAITPVLSRWERFKRATVWHSINTDPKDEDKSGPRFWYPAYDVIAFALGVYALVLGSPLLNRLFPTWFTDGMGAFLILASILCFIGVVFPRYTVLELTGKLAIVFMLGGYAGTVATLSTGAGENGFVVIVLIMSIWLLGPRITKLVNQLSKMRATRKQRDDK